MADVDVNGTGAAPVGASTFRTKVNVMKSWKPESTPSNRDRLELFALHKQAVSGDAPLKDSPDASVADRAKMNAWRSKRGMSQAESMTAYVTECDRQVRVYGTAPSGVGGDPSSSAATTPGPGGTPTNTPATNAHGESVLLTPRGIAAVPLLCAAAAESRTAYLARLRSTGVPANGWWTKQEPLCADPGTPFATPESLVLAVAKTVEGASLSAGTEWRDAVPLPPGVLQSFLWPLHNVLLAVWIVLIFICTYVGSAVVMARTVLLGARTTGAPLDRVFSEEIGPAARAAASLCEPHQAVSVRLAGLSLMPFVTLCNISRTVADSAGIVPGSMVYVLAAVLTWWYWICVLPWGAFVGVCAALMCGWCFSLIELAGV